MSDCTICFEELGSEHTTSTKCAHTFHTNCLDDWLADNRICPYCRTSDPLPLVVPLAEPGAFWFTRDAGLAIPVALPYTARAIIHIEFRDLGELRFTDTI